MSRPTTSTDEVHFQPQVSEKIAILFSKLKNTWQARHSMLNRYWDLICFEESVMLQLNIEILFQKHHSGNNLINTVYQKLEDTQSLQLESAALVKAFNQLKQLLKRYESLKNISKRTDFNSKYSFVKSETVCSGDVNVTTSGACETVKYSNTNDEQHGITVGSCIGAIALLGNVDSRSTNYIDISLANSSTVKRNDSSLAGGLCDKDDISLQASTRTFTRIIEHEDIKDGGTHAVSVTNQEDDKNNVKHPIIERSLLSSVICRDGSRVSHKTLMTSYRCSKCAGMFSSHELLQRHRCKATKISITNKNISIEGLQHCHENTHLNTMPYICQLCNKSFRTRELVRRHTDIHAHRKRYQCTECDEVFMYSIQRSKHMTKQHSLNPPPYSCSYCSYSCFERSNMSDHIRKHTNEKTQLCSECGGSFSSKSAYRLHMLTHSDIRAYKCKECGKSFRTSYHRNNHERSHNNSERSFRCATCSKTYLYSRGLRRHLSQSKGHVSKYECTRCKTNCISENHLKRHLKFCREVVSK